MKPADLNTSNGHGGIVTRWVSRLRIRARLVLAFAVLLVLLLALAALSINWHRQLAQALTELIEEQALLRETVYDVSGNAEDAARKLLVLMSTDRSMRVSAYAEIDAANRRLDAGMVLLRAASAPGARRDALAQLELRLQQYRASYTEAVDVIEVGDFDQARELLGSKTETSLSLLVDATQHLASVAEQEARERADALRQRGDEGRNIAIGVCVAGLLLGGLLALGVTRSITRPLRRAAAGARQIAAGDYDLDIEVLADDELGHMSQAMNALARAVGEREQQLLHMADTDLLTGLAQRSRFIRESDALLIALTVQDGPAVLLCIDVDRLKAVNGVLGFDAGDALLVGAARKLASLLKGQAVYGRLGGGTFVTLVPVHSLDEGASLAEQLRDEVEHKLTWQGQALDLSVSMGIAHWPEHAQTSEALLRRAEQAMFEAKRQRQQVAVYNPGLEATRVLHLSLLSDLQAAIQHHQLRQFLQPKIRLDTGALDGAEALVRWLHPDRGWLPPSEFIPFAESSGRIRQITQWMLEQAIQTLQAWQAQGRSLSIAVNISTLDIQDQTLPERLGELLAAHAVEPARLQLEVTETGLMASGADPIAVLQRLRALGVRLSIDDFGTGQSSLAYLQRLPVDELKIDRSFVKDVDQDDRRQALLRSVVGLGHSLGLSVTAEGVETQAELDVVRGCGCERVQGYLVAKPMDLPAFERWMQSQGEQAG